MSRDWRVALSMVLMMASASASGCFGGDNNDIDSSDLSVDVDVLASGFFQTVELRSSVKMSVYVPYLLLDPETGFVQNSTVIDIGKGSTVSLDVLVPPRSDGIYLLLGELLLNGINYIETADLRLYSNNNITSVGNAMKFTTRFTTNSSLISVSEAGGTGSGTRITFNQRVYVNVNISQDVEGNTDSGYWCKRLYTKNCKCVG